MFGFRRTNSGATANKSSWPLSLNSRAILPTTKSSGAMPNFLRSAKSFFAARNGSSGKPLKILRVLLRLADAGGEILFPHRVGDDEEMVGDARGVFFGGAENEIGGGVLKIAERRAVDRVNDDGTPARLAASRPRMPALPLCVWTMSGFCSRRIFSSFRSARKSFSG